ncbi:Os12g0218800 [Oryza sativa Japonica Group]|uniref:Expressed protein n=2 Tax=Oryza sativa subsp. japonica TaxID=39947 RepID=Q2QVT5_ORYSJ|nr:uncharacterized protein LOC4351794 [Oryza sativa Japonica Group]ABA96224.1 expressed protein [Oryza sativa Japonica Group]EAZ28082.1 hypothetical protein OsJ_12046 [Oryza sativa Japonica Group]EAZ28083.1 hypothetical protein OsJ_12047 [Oryza sativa Japonica Group]BAF29430.1 Os12g0218800 [Oryza sativa Japonica Group]BAG98137.1 unnamed protein product [Oryza sativa Japonica Group]|eukprot:NP_001066411.1 Os12g0218800 [Oryza sativa Japonica Group]
MAAVRGVGLASSLLLLIIIIVSAPHLLLASLPPRDASAAASGSTTTAAAAATTPVAASSFPSEEADHGKKLLHDHGESATSNSYDVVPFQPHCCSNHDLPGQLRAVKYRVLCGNHPGPCPHPKTHKDIRF